MLKLITWDSAIAATFVILLAYSLLIRKHKSLATLISLYIAYVMASTWGDRIAEFLSGQSMLPNHVWIRANVSTSVVQTILMLIVTFLISTFLKLGGKRSKYSSVEVTLYVLATVALATLFIITFLQPDQRDLALKVSKIVPFVYKWREWILVLPVFLMIFFGVYGNEEH